MNLNGGEIYDNIIKTEEQMKSNSDLFYLENGKININSIKLSGSIYKSELALIYLKSTLLKQDENSKIYIDFPNNGTNKTLISSTDYIITLEDLNLISIIDFNSGYLELSDYKIIFSPKILQISFNNSKFLNFISFLENNEEKEIYYYRKIITLSQNLFKLKENEYISKIYDQNGNEYNINDNIILTTNMIFNCQIGYKNKIVFDFIDYKEEKLIIPDEYLYLPSFRKDLSIEKEIINWKDFDSAEIFNVAEKIRGNQNRTFTAIYINNGDNFMVQIYTFGNNYLSSLMKFKEKIILPEISVPEDNHFIGWKDLCNNINYDMDVTDILIIRDYYLVTIIIGYVNYYISDQLIIQKSYDINSTFIILNETYFPNNKIIYWKNKINEDKYYSDKIYELKGDINLIAILEDKQEDNEEKNSNIGLIVGLTILGIVILLVGIFLVYRYIRLKKANSSYI